MRSLIFLRAPMHETPELLQEWLRERGCTRVEVHQALTDGSYRGSGVIEMGPQSPDIAAQAVQGDPALEAQHACPTIKPCAEGGEELAALNPPDATPSDGTAANSNACRTLGLIRQ